METLPIRQFHSGGVTRSVSWRKLQPGLSLPAPPAPQGRPWHQAPADSTPGQASCHVGTTVLLPRPGRTRFLLREPQGEVELRFPPQKPLLFIFLSMVSLMSPEQNVFFNALHLYNKINFEDKRDCRAREVKRVWMGMQPCPAPRQHRIPDSFLSQGKPEMLQRLRKVKMP